MFEGLFVVFIEEQDFYIALSDIVLQKEQERVIINDIL